MYEILLFSTLLVFGALMLNGFAAGAVAALYYWRGNRSRTKRALAGALASGITSAGSLSGALIGGDSSDYLPGTLGLALTAIVCAMVALPGAFLMSRKIAATDVVGDTFR